jgi:hypothetical protein
MGSHVLLTAPGTPTSPRSGGHGDNEERKALITQYPLDGFLPAEQSLAFHRRLQRSSQRLNHSLCISRGKLCLKTCFR